jgi:hypothetical protein
MSSEARTFDRGPRKSTVNAASVLRTTSRRNGRMRTAQQRRTSARRSSTATQLPHPRLGWYAGLAVMAIVEIIEWPLAIVMMVGHEVAHRTHRQALQDFAEGIEAGA